MKQYQINDIFNQLGGFNQFRMMTGAKQFAVDHKTDTIQFRIGKNCNSINIVRITLTAMDDYTVEFGRLRAGNYKVVNKVDGIYCDTLAETFRRYTGMETRMPRVVGFNC